MVLGPHGGRRDPPGAAADLCGAFTYARCGALRLPTKTGPPSRASGCTLANPSAAAKPPRSPLWASMYALKRCQNARASASGSGAPSIRPRAAAPSRGLGGGCGDVVGNLLGVLGDVDLAVHLLHVAVGADHERLPLVVALGEGHAELRARSCRPGSLTRRNGSLWCSANCAVRLVGVGRDRR